MLGVWGRWGRRHVGALVFFAALFFVVALTLVLADVRAWLVMRSTRETEVDFGAGPIVVSQIDPLAYRDAPTSRVTLGDPSLARSIVIGALKRDALALLVVCTDVALMLLFAGARID